MILDNQNLPEIVVSRDGTRNNNCGAVTTGSKSPAPEDKQTCDEVKRVATPQASPRHRTLQTLMKNNHGGESTTNKEHQHSLTSWNDVSNHSNGGGAVPTMSNNNGSPRLTNRIANIYNRHQVYRQPNVESPQGSPMHQAIARIVSPKRSVRKSSSLSKEDHCESAKNSLTNLCSTAETCNSNTVNGLDCTKTFILGQSPIQSPGYHNPYLLSTNVEKVIKSPLLCSNDMKFKCDSPKHKLKAMTDSPRRFFKPSISPRLVFEHNQEAERRFSVDNIFTFNMNETPRYICSNYQSSVKSRIPTKNVANFTKTIDSTNYKASVQNNLSVTDHSNDETHKTKLQSNSTITDSDNSESMEKFDNIPFSQDSSSSPKRINAIITNTNYRPNVYKYEKDQQSVEDNIFDSKTSENSEMADAKTSTGSDVWNSEALDPTSNSWGSNMEDNSVDDQSKMSIDDKHSLKRTSLDSIRPRTNSLGTWPQSGSFARDKSTTDESGMGGSLKGISVSDADSGMADSVSSKMVLIKCKDGKYLTRLFVNTQGIQGVKVVGRVGSGLVNSTSCAPSSPAKTGHTAADNGGRGSVGSATMSAAPSVGSVTMSAAPSPLHQPHCKVSGSCEGDSSSCSISATGSSCVHEEEFDHGTADYQWLLDYEYRESYTRESLGATRDGSMRVSVLDPNPEANLQDLSYETLSRNLDANLAEIDMDDFRSDDIHQLLVMPSVCGQCHFEDADMVESACEEVIVSVPQSTDNTPTKSRGNRHSHHHHSHHHHHHHQCRHKHEAGELCGGEEYEEEELSGVSGEISLYQSGPLFSPLKDPPPIGNTTFSVDSLDCESLHEDLILTCQANKDNYTIAFEGSFVQYSEESDYQEAAGETDSNASGSWAADRLGGGGGGGRSIAPTMTHSDQPYTTWSRVSRKSSSSYTPEHLTPKQHSKEHMSPAARQQLHHLQQQQQQQQQQHTHAKQKQQCPAAAVEADQNNSKSNSMPNLMRRSLMRQSLETGVGHCVKVFDLQNSLRSSQSGRPSDGNSFSLVRLFMKQKSLSKEAISLSSSCTSRSHEGACCSSSENQSAVDSSDWPMNSQSDDMDGSASPVPALRHNQSVLDRNYRRRSGGDLNPRNMNSHSGDYTTTDMISPTNVTNTLENDGCLVNNNNTVNQILDNSANMTACDNITFEESVKEVIPCSKPPVTSPIREEPEGMDISFDSRCENKLINDQSETETKSNASLSSIENNRNSNAPSPARTPTKEARIKNPDDKHRSKSPGTPKRTNRRESSQRQRQDSGNSSSGYASVKGSTEKVRRSSESNTPHHTPQRPRPKPRALKQMADQCLQTSNFKVSASMNTSNLMNRKDVYVYYPNYALPDLSFLKDKKYSVDARIFLVPQHYNRPPVDLQKIRDTRTKRPYSCNDMERLRKRGLSHVKDWDSLNVLLPKEMKEMLSDNTDCMETVKPSFCSSPRQSRRPVSCGDLGAHRQVTDVKTSSSNSSLNSTQPSSGYRGSSTMLNDSDDTTAGEEQVCGDNPPPLPKRSVSLPYEDEEDCERPPPRPPLPRGILRKTTSLKDEKQGVKKRHSAMDNNAQSKDDAAKRRSLQEPLDSSAKKSATKDQSRRQEGEDLLSAEMGCSCINTCTGFCGKGLQKKNILRVSELPDVSSHEEFTEQDLIALRSQVSNFLVGKTLNDVECDLCPKKSVTFAEKNCNHNKMVEPTRSLPENECNKSGGEERPLVYDVQDKKILVMSVRSAVEKVVHHFSQAQANKLRGSPGSMSSKVSQITLDKLCPAVYALLSDGLQPSLHSLFGKISNSVWRVVEATSQMGPSTKALNDLVLTLNSEDCLTEGPMKFNAFIFGLLNIRSLDSWLSYLRTRESVLQKHYHPEAFLYLANTATRTLYDDMLQALRPLALMPLHLDLLYEYKLLHASLLKMEERLMMHTSGSASPSDRPASVLLDQLLVAKETKEFKNTAAAQQDRVKALMKVLTSPDATEEDLLQTVASTVSKERSKAARPRSCYENAVPGVDDLHPALKKRWSNVQLGSKLITAIDKLMLEETAGASGSSGDYTDSIDNPKHNRVASICSDDDTAADMRLSDISNKDDDISERSATDKDTENEKGGRICPTSLLYSNKDQESEGEKFRRLQMKWERMAEESSTSPKQQKSNEEYLKPSGSNSPSNSAPNSGQINTTPAVSPSQTARDKVVSPSSGTRSRIPRPVSMTSPQRPFKPFEPNKEKTSPQIKPPMHTRGKDLPKPAPRRSLKDKALEKQDDHSNRPMSVRSRMTPKGPTAAVTATGNRASSMPGRSDSSDRVGGRGSAQGWGSGGRYVQTLHHRLATDNGHLSFNRGDVLTVVVEVDDRYLLCCLNDRKGLVPRASVIVCADQ